jgi:hypothetical protein
MSNPFRVTVPSSTSTQSRAGRSLTDITDAHEKEKTAHRKNFRGRRGKRQPAKKPSRAPPRIRVGQPGYLPIGDKEWHRQKKEQNPNFIISCTLGDMTEPEKAAYRRCFPRISKKLTPHKLSLSPTDAAISQGWEHHEEPLVGENGKIYGYDTFWTHPKYSFGNDKNKENNDQVFKSGIVIWFGGRYEVPLTGTNSDLLGLSYNFTCKPSGVTFLSPNDWKNFWDTRRGHRKSKYLDYQDYRQEIKKEYEDYQSDNKNKSHFH